MRDEFGRRGEKLAEKHLRRAGMRTVARRFRTPVGELDLVMRDGPTLVFVEVKTRRSNALAPPQDQVRASKQRRVVRAARWFLESRRLTGIPVRFDVVAVVWPEGADPVVTHIRDAFGAS